MSVTATIVCDGCNKRVSLTDYNTVDYLELDGRHNTAELCDDCYYDKGEEIYSEDLNINKTLQDTIMSDNQYTTEETGANEDFVEMAKGVIEQNNAIIEQNGALLGALLKPRVPVNPELASTQIDLIGRLTKQLNDNADGLAAMKENQERVDKEIGDEVDNLFDKMKFAEQRTSQCRCGKEGADTVQFTKFSPYNAVDDKEVIGVFNDPDFGIKRFFRIVYVDKKGWIFVDLPGIQKPEDYGLELLYWIDIEGEG